MQEDAGARNLQAELLQASVDDRFAAMQEAMQRERDTMHERLEEMGRQQEELLQLLRNQASQTAKVSDPVRQPGEAVGATQARSPSPTFYEAEAYELSPENARTTQSAASTLTVCHSSESQ